MLVRHNRWLPLGIIRGPCDAAADRAQRAVGEAPLELGNRTAEFPWSVRPEFSEQPFFYPYVDARHWLK